MRYDAEHKDRTRARVLQAAAAAIRTDGPDRVGVADVMKRAGLTHGGFYAHFASREALVLAAIGEMFSGARGAFERVTRDRPAHDALIAYVDFYLSPRHRDARESGCPLPVLSSELPRLPQEARVQFGQGVARLCGLMSGLLTELGRPDAEALAGSALTEMIGALSLARAVADPAQSDTILANSRSAVLRRLDL